MLATQLEAKTHNTKNKTALTETTHTTHTTRENTHTQHAKFMFLILQLNTHDTQDGSSDGASGRGKSRRNSRKDKQQRGGDFDVAGLLRKMAKIGVDDLRRQLKNPLKEMQVRVLYCRVWSIVVSHPRRWKKKKGRILSQNSPR